MNISSLQNGLKTSIHEQALEREMRWLASVMDTRIKLYFGQDSVFSSIDEVPGSESKWYQQWDRQHKWKLEDRLFFCLTIAPIVAPQLLDILLIRNKDIDQRFTEFGGRTHASLSILEPTMETLLFLLCGASVSMRSYFLKYYNQHFLVEKDWINLERSEVHLPNCCCLKPTAELVHAVIYQQDYTPEFSMTFPARKLTTALNWDDLVLENESRERVEEINTWITLGEKMLQQYGLADKIKPGFRALFHGPPGTGKTFTAALLGSKSGYEVYRIDLSLVVSKYIGETEKNLTQIFDKAAHKKWILFFDEADALFGKRTHVKDAHDRYANQEVSYLLQKVEDYPGVIILATNFMANMDEAFARRFQSIISFPMPAKQERMRLWQKMLSTKTTLHEDVQLENIAEQYELSGGSIMNVVRYVSLQAMKDGADIIHKKHLVKGISLELEKEGRSM